MRDVALAIKTLREYLTKHGYTVGLMGKQQLTHFSVLMLRKEQGYFKYTIDTEGVMISFRKKISNAKKGEAFYEDTIRVNIEGDWTVHELMCLVATIVIKAKLV